MRSNEPDAGSQPEVVVLADRAALAADAADRIATALSEAARSRGRADWATTGGSLAPPVYRVLADTPVRDRVPWPATHVWWGDDRYVPRDHPLSNVKPFDDILLALAWTQGGQVALGQSGEPTPVPIPIENLHPFPTTVAIGEARGRDWCAASLAAELDGAGLERQDGWPVLDLILVGVGADAHLLSVFPASAAFDMTDLALSVPAPTHIEPHVERVTLNPALLSVARRVLVLAAGAEKAAVLARVFGEERDPRRWPAQLALGRNALWLLDGDAAARLDH